VEARARPQEGAEYGMEVFSLDVPERHEKQAVFVA
jgi:hypothetical protein